MVYFRFLLVFSILQAASPASAETAAGLCQRCESFYTDSLLRLEQSSCSISGNLGDTSALGNRNCKDSDFKGCNENWIKTCRQYTYNLPKEDRSSCTIDPTKVTSSTNWGACGQGIAEAFADTAMGPYYVAMAVTNFVSSIDASCKKIPKELSREAQKMKGLAGERENTFMKNVYGKRPAGTWESLSCDQLSQINICQSFDPSQKTEACKDAADLKADAEESYSQSYFSKPGKTLNPGQFELVLNPQSYSAGIIKARLKQCSALQQSAWGKMERGYLRDLRDIIGKEGSCAEAFNSIMTMFPLGDSKYDKKKPSSRGCFSDKYLSKRDCKIAANIAQLIVPTAFGVGLKVVKSSTEAGAELLIASQSKAASIPSLDTNFAKTADQVLNELGSKNAYEWGAGSNLTLNGRPARIVVINYGEKPVSILISQPAQGIMDKKFMEELKSVVGKDGQIVESSNPNALENSVSINCHGYACAINNVPGLPAGWVQGVAESYTLNQNPLGNILNRYFTKVSEASKSTESQLISNGTVKPGDLITYIDSSGGNVHSGIVVRSSRTGKIMIRSKLGAGVTIDAPPGNIGMLYEYNRVEIWRRNQLTH